MATETRAFYFTAEDDTITTMASVTVPTVRTYVGTTDGPNGPILYVRGDWALSTTSVTWSWLSHPSLPTTDTTVAVFGSSGWGFYGVCVET